MHNIHKEFITSTVVSPPLSNVVITGTWLVQAAAETQFEMGTTHINKAVLNYLLRA